MSINITESNKKNAPLVIRKRVDGLQYGDPGVPEWAMREMEKGMGLPVSDTVVVKTNQEVIEMEQVIPMESLQSSAETEVTVSEFKPELKEGQLLELLALSKTEGVNNKTLLECSKIVFNKKLNSSWISPGKEALAKMLEIRLFGHAV